MISTILNFAVAVIERRHRDARRIAQSLSMEDWLTASKLHDRLLKAADSVANQKVADTLDGLLGETLKLQPDPSLDDKAKQVFFVAVTAVERLIEQELLHALAKAQHPCDRPTEEELSASIDMGAFLRN